MQASSKSIFLKDSFFVLNWRLCFVSDCETCTSRMVCQGGEERAHANGSLKERREREERGEGKEGEERESNRGKKRERPAIIVLGSIQYSPPLFFWTLLGRRKMGGRTW